ncbi:MULTISPECIES: hypothetical protein [Rhizobium/Agrobacterium group]|nr:hypothetical protein [Rhizobium rhizogenes]
MKYDWSGKRTRRIMIAQRLGVACLLSLALAAPVLALLGDSRMQP